MSWTYTVVAACLLLLCLLLWKESNRENRSRLLWRLFASAVAAASLACMALPLRYQRLQVAGSNEHRIVLTVGFNADSVKKFIQRFERPPVVYSLGATKTPGLFVSATQNLPEDSLAVVLGDGATDVFGYGFSGYQIGQIKEKSFSFHPSSLPPGVRSVHWNRRLQQGEPLVVQGSCFNPTGLPLTVMLGGLDTGLDSALIAPRSTNIFTLSTTPKLTGRALYALTVLSGADTVEHEPLALQVDTASPVRVLILSSSPDFENKFLKSWLAAHRYQVAVRTRITTGKYSRLAVNRPAATPGQVDRALLSQFDALVCDPASIGSLQPREIAAVTGAAEHDGMGLVLRADSALPRALYSSPFRLLPTADSLRRRLDVHTIDAVADTAQWWADQPVYIRARPGLQPLAQTVQSDIVAGSSLYGNGKIVLTTINNSYSWLLAGNEKMYSAFWSLLIRKAARRRAQREVWSHSPALPVANEPVTLLLEAAGGSVPQYTVGGATIAYRQNALLPFQWQSDYWPAAGWQATAAGADSLYRWFAYDPHNWKSIHAAEDLLRTENYLAYHPDKKKKAQQRPVYIKELIPKIYLFAVFVLSAAFLWIEKNSPDKLAGILFF